MRISSKINLLLLLFAFLATMPAQADIDDKDKDKDKKAQQSDTALSKSQFVCNTGSASVDLDVNNVQARLYNNGHLFWRGSGNVYTVPKTGRANAIFASGIWLGGMVGNEMRFAGTDYGPFEFFPGPLDDQGNPPADCTPYDRIYSITRADLDAFEAGEPHTADIEDWPWELGAPVVDGDGNPNNYDLAAGDRPELIGTQTAWWIMNDVAGPHGWSQSAPLGLEVQVTAFAFRRADALNNTTFYRYKLIYKGNEQLTNAYFGIWSDPDLGNAGDDFVGSDTTLGMGFVYNGDDFDDTSVGYGGTPPALGYDYFQGPLVNNDGVDNDEDGTVDEDDERIAMTKFVYYNNDSSPQGNPFTGAEAYGYLRGIWRDGAPITLGGTGYGGDVPVDFMFPGDPVTGQFWSEENTDNAGARNTPADRRFLLSSGPFVMNPGDEQEIVYGIVWAQAGDRLASVAKMKADDALAQAAFDVNFQLPSAPDVPVVRASASDETVTLSWTNPASSNNYLESYDVPNPFLEDVPDEVAPDKSYTFEGYRIFRYRDRQQGDLEGELVATFDVPNDVTTVTDTEFDEQTGVPITVVVARGSDGGVQHSITFSNLTNYTEYHYGVQAYAYNEFSAPKVLASPVNRVTVTPRAVDTIAGGTVIADSTIASLKAAADTTGADIVSCDINPNVPCVTLEGVGEGRVSANIVDPTALTGHTYEVQFKAVTDNSDPEHPVEHIVYDIVDVTTGQVRVDGAAYFASTGQPTPLRENVAVVDGLAFSVQGPQPGIKRFLATANAAGPLEHFDTGTASFNSNGFPTPNGAAPHCEDDTVLDWDICNDRPTTLQQVGEGRWIWQVGGSADGTYSTYLDRSVLGRGRPLSSLGAYDYEWRFTGTSVGIRAFDDGVAFEVPFEIWRTGVGTPDDPSDDVRMIPWVCEEACGGGMDSLTFDIGTDHPVSGGANDPLSDWVYWILPTDASPGDAGYQAYAEAALAGTYDYSGSEILARQVLVGFNMGEAPPYAQMTPEDGTVFRIETFKPNQPGDKFVVNTSELAVVTGDQATAEAGIESIGIVPNPYKGASNYEVSVTDDVVRFTNLPDRARIRVFTLSGTLVWDEIRGAGNNEWNLETSEGLPLASGMYLVVVEVEGVGEKIIKFGVVKKRIQLDLL